MREAIWQAVAWRIEGSWRYRVGDYRIVAKIEDERLLVLVVIVGNRRDVYDYRRLHPAIVRTATAFGRHPVDVLVGVLDVTRLAVDAVGGVDLVAEVRTLAHPFVDRRRAVERRRTAENVVFRGLLQRRVADLEMRRLVLVVAGAGEEDRRQTVEGERPVGPGIRDAASPPTQEARWRGRACRDGR